MTTVATSLKLPAALKDRLVEIAERSGQTPHAYMLLALEDRVQQDERAREFRRDAIAADKAMARSGKGYPAKEVHAYIADLVAGKKARRPPARAWRK